MKHYTLYKQAVWISFHLLGENTCLLAAPPRIHLKPWRCNIMRQKWWGGLEFWQCIQILQKTTVYKNNQFQGESHENVRHIYYQSGRICTFQKKSLQKSMLIPVTSLTPLMNPFKYSSILVGGGKDYYLRHYVSEREGRDGEEQNWRFLQDFNYLPFVP